MCKGLGIALFCLGLACFVPFFVPTFHHNIIPNGTEDKFLLGLPTSPWLESTKTETKVETKIENPKPGGALYSSSMNLHQTIGVQWIAWSWLFPIIGAAAIIISRRTIASSSENEKPEDE
jgi:hypothetical protein